MKRFAKIIVTALFTLIYGVSGAQIKFFKNFYDFGEIAEDGGKKECVFSFRNTSSEPIIVLDAYTSCGCTKAEFSKKPVAPDSVSYIKVIYNPMNYPGKFARKVTIVTNRGTLKDQLLVTGNVIPRKKSVEECYPITLGGGVRVATNAHSFGYIEHGKEAQASFEIFNSSERGVSLAIKNPYSELEFYCPTEVKAGEGAKIDFGCLLPEKSSIYGSVTYSVWLLVDGVKVRYPFIINGLAIDSREENANNREQMIVMSENFIKFGAVKCDVVKLAREIEVQNLGDRAIDIRKLELTSEGFSADLKGDSTIEAGGRRKINVEIYPSQLPLGAVVERLRIVSNDPQMPVLTIRLSAIVER